MKIIIATFLLLSVLIANAESYENLYRKIVNLDVNASEAYKVEGLFHSVEGISIQVESGEIYFMEDVNSKKIFSVILGEGSASLMTTDVASILNFKKQTELESPVFEFKSALIIADDNFADMIRKNYQPLEIPNTFESRDVYNQLAHFYFNKKYDIMDSDLIRVIKSKANDKFFSINFESNKDIYTLEYNEYTASEIRLYQNVKTKGTIDSYKRSLIVVNSISDTTSRNINDFHQIIKANKLTADIKLIGDHLEAEAYTKIECTRLDNEQRFINFSLSSDLEIDSIKVNSIKIDDYHRIDDFSLLYFDLPDEAVGDFEIHVWYKGEMFKHLFNFVLKSFSWYPRYSGKELIYYDINISHPNKYSVIGTGNITVNEISKFEDKTNLTHELPTDSPTLEIGSFSSDKVELSNGFKLNLFYDNSIEIEEISGYFEKSLNVFTQILGDLEYKELNVWIPRDNTELANDGYNYANGTGFTASVSTYNSSERATSDFQDYVSANFIVFPYLALEQYPLLAVESRVSKFWFNKQFKPDSYRESWIYYGIENYLSLLLMESFPDYEKRLETQQNSLKNDFYMLYNDYEPGPISLGGLISKTNTNLFGYTILKSIKFMHMLRHLTYDFANMNEKPFMSILKSTFNSGENGYFTEQDFIDVLSSSFGQDMSWYVNQWAVLDYVPKIEYAFQEETSGSKTNVKMAIKRTECPPNFVVSVPVVIIFEDGSYYKPNIIVNQELTIIELPALAGMEAFDQPIDEILVNDKDFQIGDFDEEDWEDVTATEAGE